MTDLFSYGSENPAPVQEARASGCRPWAGCDTSSEAWRAYCEAFGHAKGYKDAPDLWSIAKHRGKDGRALLEAQIRIVKRDLAGEIYPRSRLAELILNALKNEQEEANRAEVKRRLERKL